MLDNSKPSEKHISSPVPEKDVTNEVPTHNREEKPTKSATAKESLTKKEKRKQPIKAKSPQQKDAIIRKLQEQMEILDEYEEFKANLKT